MTVLIHYLARTPVSPLHFEIHADAMPTGRTLESLRTACAADAATKSGRKITASDIIIANIIPLADE